MEVNATKMGQNESQAAAAAAVAAAGSSEKPMHAYEPKTGNNETGTVPNSTQSSNINQTTGNNETSTETKGSKTGNNETGTVSNSTQSSSANQTTDAAARDSPPPVLSIFLVNDLQYDIFPVHPENGSRCDMDPGKYPSMGCDVQMAMRIKFKSLRM
jgi:hypothetical protein